MKKRTLKSCTSFLLLVVMCFQLTTTAYATSVNPTDTATRENVLEVLSQYDADAYHILTTASGLDFIIWFMGGSIISGMDAAVHETYHLYTHSQSSGFYGEKIYIGDGKSYDVDYSIVYQGGSFTKTEEMAKQIPPQLRTFRYGEYVAPGADPDANTKGVFGLLNEFTAYYWGLETMNSLAQFLIDSDAGASAWRPYVTSIGNDLTAYAEFKYWTLRYMLYIKSANPSLYQKILDNKNYCAAYRDADAAFSSEIERSREIINNSADYMRTKGFSVDWSDSEIKLSTDSSSSLGGGITVSFGTGADLEDYNALMAELDTVEYREMDAVLKGAPLQPSGTESISFTDVPEWCAAAVSWAVEKGITTGTSATTFTPDRTCTTTEIITLLWRAAGQPSSSAQLPFTVNKGLEYAEGALRWACGKGMIDANFNQTAPCTRSSAVKFIWQAEGSPAVSTATGFTDVPAGADYAQAVAWAVSEDIVRGTTSTTFSPGQTCTRAQIVTLLYRNRSGKT